MNLFGSGIEKAIYTVCCIGIIGASIPLTTYAIAQRSVRSIRYDHTYYFEKMQIDVIEDPGIETEFPQRARPNPQQDKTDLSYRVHDVLPYSQDRSADTYLVYPKHGIVVPVLAPNILDLGKTDNSGRHYKYLQQGALHYVGDAPDQGVGNMVVAAHSSFKSSLAGRYPTVFQVLPITTPGDKIFVYTRNKQDSFDFHEYTVTASYQTEKYNTSVLDQATDRPKLTTYGCFPLGTNDERRVNEAYLSNSIIAHSSLDRPTRLLADNTDLHSAAPIDLAESIHDPITSDLTQQIKQYIQPDRLTTKKQPTPQPVITTTPPANSPSGALFDKRKNVLSYQKSPSTISSAISETPSTHTATPSKVAAYLQNKQAVTEESSQSEHTAAPRLQAPLTIRITHGALLKRAARHLLTKAQFKSEAIQQLHTKIIDKIELARHQSTIPTTKLGMLLVLRDEIESFMDGN